MEACRKRNEGSVLRLRKIASSLSGSESENSGDNMAVKSPRAMGRKRIALPTEISENELCSMQDGQNLGLDSLPLAILVRIFCNVSHDELDTLSSVSGKFREAVNVARHMHFDYKTPVRVKASKRLTNSLLLNAPKKSGKFHKSRLSSQIVKELQTSTRQARMRIEDL